MILIHFLLWIVCCVLGGWALAESEENWPLAYVLIAAGVWNAFIFFELSGLVGGAA